MSKLEAGRELDARVAEKVMGQGSGYPLPNDFHYIAEIPYYSTDIAAAWEVVEKLKDDGYTVQLWSYSGSCCYGCAIARPTDGFQTPPLAPPTMPLAICRAALAVVSTSP